MKRFGLLLLALVSGAPSLGFAAPQQQRYEIAWRSEASPVAEVTARLTSGDCRLRTSAQWASFFPDTRGWSRFMENLTVEDDRGRPLSVEAIENGWQIAHPRPCRVVARYRVDFAFGRRSWEAGAEQVAYATDHAAYTTGLPLFLLGDEGPLQVTFRTPADWAVSTPWRWSAGRYRPVSRSALLSNTLVVGRHAASRFRAENLTVTAALPGDMEPASGRLTQAFDRIVPGFVRLFADTEADDYMFVVMPGPEDGESFVNSFAVVTRETPTDANRIVWANHLAHELLHYWIGGKLAPTDADSDALQWFTEGITEYLADAVLAEQGLLTDEQYLDRLGRHAGYYLLTRENPNFADVSLAAAGQHKWRNRPLVYSGGALFGFCLDQEIRKASDGRRRLADVMRTLYAKAKEGEPFSSALVIQTTSEVAGKNLSDMFARYVDGTETLPLRQCMSSAGITADVQGYNVFLRR